MAAAGGSSWGLGVTFYLIGSVLIINRAAVGEQRLVEMIPTLLTAGSCFLCTCQRKQNPVASFLQADHKLTSRRGERKRLVLVLSE